MSGMSERFYEDCQTRLETSTVKSFETIMLTLPIVGCLEAVRLKASTRALQVGGSNYA